MKLIANVSLLQTPWCCLVLTVGISMAGNTSADIIVTGQLTYDSETHLITSTTGNTYLGIEIPHARTYNYVVNTILTNPLYEHYHVATHAEAYEFYNSAISPLTPVVDTPEDQDLTTDIDGIRDRFGPQTNRDYRYGNFAPIWFFSDIGESGIGLIRSYEGALVINDYWAGIASTTYHTYGYGHTDYFTWLIVKPNVVFMDGYEVED